MVRLWVHISRCVGLPHELFVFYLVALAAVNLHSLLTAGQDVYALLNLHYAHRGFVILLFHNSFFNWVATLKILYKIFFLF